MWFLLVMALLAATGGEMTAPQAVVVQRAEFWCPMHPNERSPIPAACPICKMTMVPIPPVRIGEYRMDVEQMVSRLSRGISGLRIVIRDPATSEPVASLETVHERPLHLFVVSRSLEYFAHVHPEPVAGGAFEIRQSLPAGEYMVVADFLPRGGSPQTLQRAIVTPGASGSSQPARITTSVLTRTERGLRTELLTEDLAAGRNAHLTFNVTSASGGEPVTDLEPYLGAPAHLFIASADLTDTRHAHPDATAASGSRLTFDVTLPKPGGYRMWLQIQRQGNVITLPFTLVVSSEAASPRSAHTERWPR
jgi:hypothetical protein